MADNSLLTQAIVSSLLYSRPEWEEITHPWGSAFSVNPDLPLLRTWDEFLVANPAKAAEC